MHISSWVSDKSAFKEGDIEDGGIKVDELEQEHFERQIVIEFGLGSMHFWKKKKAKSTRRLRVSLFFGVQLILQILRSLNIVHCQYTVAEKSTEMYHFLRFLFLPQVVNFKANFS